MNTALRTALSTTLNTPVRFYRSLAGGMISQVYQVETDAGTVVVKSAERVTADWFQAEADGLSRLRAAKALRVPEVLAIGDDACPFLVLEWLEVVPVQNPVRFTEHFAEQLAHQHRTAVAPDGRFGLERDNYIGSLPQQNAPISSWVEFYRSRRLLPQIQIARSHRLLTPEQDDLFLTVCDKLDDLLEDMAEPATLLHGDLWSGNFLCLAGDEPALIDPSTYYGPREMEMAYIELFGGFPTGFVAAYRSAYPPAAGYERRRAVHQLYPLLVHINHFGEPYITQTEELCRRLLQKG